MRIAVVLLLLAGSASAKPKLERIEDGDVELLAPVGWDASLSPWKVDVKQPKGEAYLSLAAYASTGDIEVLIDRTLPGAKHKRHKGWTCAEGKTDDERWRLAVCARATEGVIVLVGMSASPKLYKSLGGAQMVLKVAQSAKGMRPQEK